MYVLTVKPLEQLHILWPFMFSQQVRFGWLLKVARFRFQQLCRCRGRNRINLNEPALEL